MLCDRLRRDGAKVAYIVTDLVCDALQVKGVDILPLGTTSMARRLDMIGYYVKRFAPTYLLCEQSEWEEGILGPSFPRTCVVQLFKSYEDAQGKVDAIVAKDSGAWSCRPKTERETRGTGRRPYVRFCYFPTAQCSLSYTMTELAMGMERAGMEISIYPLPSAFCDTRFLLGRRVFRSIFAGHANFISSRVRSGEWRRPDVTIYHGINTEESNAYMPFAPRTPVTIAYATGHGYRSRALVSYVRRKFDVLWVPSGFVRDGFADAGYPEDRIFIVPHGVDQKQALAIHSKSGRGVKDRWVFLQTSFPWVNVKGFDICLRAFVEEFGESDVDAKLIVKTCPTADQSHRELEKLTASASARCRGSDRIEFICRYLKTDEHYRLYGSCHVLVHPCRAEGFGISVLEALACGRTAIVPEKGGHMEFCRYGSVLPIACCSLPSPSRRVEPDIEHLKMRMRFSYENRDDVIRSGLERAPRVAHMWSWDAASRKAEQALSAIGA